MDTAHKLNVKIGSAEFSAEGSEATVKEQFELFLQALAASPPALKSPPPPPGRAVEPAGQPAKEKQDDKSAQDLFVPGDGNGAGNGGLPKELLDRIFIVDGNDTVSLRTLPQTSNRDADALLMLLYGFQTLRGQQHVGAVRLMKAAEQSGLQLERVDRVLMVHKQYVQTGGARRGKRYNLNNPGMEFAKTLVRQVQG